MTDAPNFRDLSGLTTLLKASLGVYMAVAAIGLWSGWLEIEILQRAASGAGVSEAEAAASDSRQALLGGLYLLVFVITGIMFLRWTYLSNLNARSLGATGMQFTPGWAVGWYFIPVATLWKPYQALKETFKASHPEFTQDWQNAPHPSILPLWWTLWIMWTLWIIWWTLWIIGTFIGQAVFRSALRADTVDELLASSWITLVSDAVNLPLGIVAMTVVAKLQTWQSEKRHRVAVNSREHS